MSSTINASTSAGIVQTADTSGTLALQANGTTIATISSTGLTMNSGNIVQASTAAPAFFAYKNASNQTVSSNVYTKSVLDGKLFDTANCFDNTTNYRFTPNVAGYYQIQGAIYTSNSGGTNNRASAQIYKNGSAYAYGTYINSQTLYDLICTISAVVYFNGTTDYVELWGVEGINSGTGIFFAGQSLTYFSGAMVRSA
jgi:hypothetical protein